MAAEGGVPAVAVFGSATCDLLLGVEALPRAGETVLSKEGYVLAGGGKGANQACAATCAGAAVEMVACVGRDQFAEVALGNLRRRGVRVAARESDDGVPTALAMVACSTATGENQIIVAAGANMCLRASDFEGTSAALAEARKDPTRPWAVLLQSEVSPEENWAVAAAAHAAGAFVLLNNAPTARVPREVYRHLDMLAVNEVEVEQMLRFMGIVVEELRVQDSAQSRGVVTALGCTSDATASRAIEAGRCLYIATSVTVCLTLGEHGAVVFNEDGATAVRQTLRVEVEDTVGAGDAFIGGMAAALTAQVPLEEAIRRGVAAGTLACAGKGAQNAAPSAEQIAAAAKQLVARVVPPDTPIE